MNAARRKSIEKARYLIEQGHGILEDCMNEEQEYYDNMPESLQNSEKGEAASAAVDAMQQIIDDMDGVINGDWDTATV